MWDTQNNLPFGCFIMRKQGIRWLNDNLKKTSLNPSAISLSIRLKCNNSLKTPTQLTVVNSVFFHINHQLLIWWLISHFRHKGLVTSGEYIKTIRISWNQILQKKSVLSHSLEMDFIIHSFSPDPLSSALINPTRQVSLHFSFNKMATNWAQEDYCRK